MNQDLAWMQIERQEEGQRKALQDTFPLLHSWLLLNLDCLASPLPSHPLFQARPQGYGKERREQRSREAGTGSGRDSSDGGRLSGADRKQGLILMNGNVRIAASQHRSGSRSSCSGITMRGAMTLRMIVKQADGGSGN